MSLAILCPGQGDQSPAMFAPFADQPEAQKLFELCAERLGSDPRTMDIGQLQVNRIAQPVLCAVQLAAWRFLRGALPPVTLFAGYSLGELAAYGCADSLSEQALFDLAISRADSMDRCGAGGRLLAVRGLTLAQLRPLSAEYGVEIAIINGHDRVVLGGVQVDLQRIEPRLVALGAKPTRLAVAVASHTSLMKAAADQFALTMQNSRMENPRQPVLAGINGNAVFRRETAIPALAQQLRQTLDWAACMDAMVERGCRAALELGPGDALTRMLRDRHPQFPVRAIGEFHGLAGAAQWAGRAVEDFHGASGGV